MDSVEKVADLRELHKAYRRVRRGKKGRVPAIRFALNPMEGLCRLKWGLEDQSYHMGRYTSFCVERPVHREISTCAYQDKIVLRAFSENVLWPIVNPHLIEDNYASRKGYGTHYALDRLEENLHAYFINHGSTGWVVTIDATKYFHNLVHQKIHNDFLRYGSDEWTMWLTDIILDSVYQQRKRGYVVDDLVQLCDMPGMDELDIGSPLGNVTSQVHAVQYPNAIDHFVKDQCGIKYYGRYMDDSYIIHHDKAYLESLLSEIRKRYGNIGLELNRKTQIQPLKNGVKFLGMHFYLSETGKVTRRLKPTNLKYERVHLREFAAEVAAGRMTEESYWKRFEAWDNHASHADAKAIRTKMKLFAQEVLNNAYRRERRELGKE
mgnify:CR=1 FL=1